MSTLRFVGRSVGIVPSELNASVVGESCPGYWAWHPDGYWICVSYELEGVTGTGEDPCDDDFGYWDDGVGEEGGCRCYSGADWGDPDTADWPCQEPDSPPDDDDPPGGQSGPGPDEVCDPDLGPCDPCDPIDEICEPAYTLSCTDAVRGATVTCTLTGSTSEIEQVEWHFTGGGLSASHIGTEPSWSGTAAVGGTVTATVSYGTGVDEALLSADFEVSPRSWSWDRRLTSRDAPPPIRSSSIRAARRGSRFRKGPDRTMGSGM